MNRLQIFIFSFAFICLLTGCNSDEIDPDSIDGREYEIYSLILDHQFRNKSDFIIREISSKWWEEPLEAGNSTFQYLKDSIPHIDPVIFDNYISINEAPIHFDSTAFAEVGKVVNFMSREEFLDPERGWFLWDLFYEKYPESNGVMVFTQVGFNSDKTQAIVEFEHHFSHGEGYFVYLERNSDQSWEIVVWDFLWIS